MNAKWKWALSGAFVGAILSTICAWAIQSLTVSTASPKGPILPKSPTAQPIVASDRPYNSGLSRFISDSNSAGKKTPNSILENALRSLSAGLCSPAEFNELMGYLGQEYGPDLLRDVLANGELNEHHQEAVARFVQSSSLSAPRATVAILNQDYGADLAKLPARYVKSLADGIARADMALIKELAQAVNPTLRSPLQAGWIDGLVREKGFSAAVPEINASEVLRGLNPNTNAENAVAGLAIEAGPTATQKFFTSLPNSTEGMTLGLLGTQFGRAYPKQALSWADGLPSGSRRAAALSGVTSSLAESNPELALDYTQRFKGTKAELVSILNGLNTAFGSSGQSDWAQQVTEALLRLDKENR